MTKNLGVIVLLALSVLSALPGCRDGGESRWLPQKVEKGVIDLKRWNFQGHGLIALNGMWEFYWERLLAPTDFLAPGKSSEPSYLKVPGSWNGYLHHGAPVDPASFATYRLVVRLGDGDKRKYAVKIPEITNPVRIWVDGTCVNGTMGVDFEAEKRYRSNYRPFIYSFTPSSPRVEIIVQMVNNNHLRGGLRNPPVLGPEPQVRDYFGRLLHLEIFLAGIQVIIALYHLSLYFLRRRDLSNLFFSFLCLCTFVRTGVTGENFLLVHFPGLPMVPQLKLEALSYYLAVISAYLFISSLFGEYAHRVVTRIIVGLGAIFCLFVGFTSTMVYPHSLVPFQVFTVMVGIYCFYIFYRAYPAKKKEVLLIVVAWAVMFLFTLNDILYTDNLTAALGYLMPFGIAFFIFTQSFVISMKFSHAYRDNERLAGELERNNLMLEDKVRERTVELVEKNRLLEEAQSVAAKDMAMAVKVQASVMPQAAPEVPGWETAFKYSPMSGVSGDFFDFYIVEGLLRGVGIFDVSGHGISSGLVATLAKWIINRSFLNNLDSPLGEVFGSVRDVLFHAIGSTSYFLTGIVLRIDGGHVEYANAGHLDLYCKRGNLATPMRHPDGTPVQGVLLGYEYIVSDYEHLSFEVGAGDFLVLYTDCIIEALNGEGEQFGTNRLQRAIEEAPGGSARGVLDHLMRVLDGFREGVNLSDDLTIIVMKKI